MKATIFIFLLFFPASLAAQNTVFREDFNDNKNKWWTGRDDHYEASIENGYYQVNYKLKEKPEKNLLIARNKFNIQKNWEIETRIKVVSMEGKQNSFGIFVGELDRGNSHYYILSPELKMSWWCDNKMYKQTVITNEPLPLNIFDKDDVNTGTKIYMKQRDGMVHFYVNDVLMTKVASPDAWFGNGVGLYSNAGTVLRVDYLEIRQ